MPSSSRELDNGRYHLCNFTASRRVLLTRINSWSTIRIRGDYSNESVLPGPSFLRSRSDSLELGMYEQTRIVLEEIRMNEYAGAYNWSDLFLRSGL